MLAELTGATLGFLTEAANTVGAHLALARPQQGGMHARAMQEDPRHAYLMLHAEPEFDFANAVGARAALEKADLVVVMSPFKHGTSYADVLLPVAPFTETAGTFVSSEGRVQSFPRRRAAAGRYASGLEGAAGAGHDARAARVRCRYRGRCARVRVARQARTSPPVFPTRRTSP